MSLPEQEIREAFNLFDKDSAGSIRTKDVGVVLQSLGFSLSAVELERMEKDADPDSLGFVKFPEFSRQVAQATVLAKASNVEAKRSILKLGPSIQNLFESNPRSDDTVTIHDLKKVFTTIGERMSPEEFGEMCRELGVDNKPGERISMEKVVNFLII